MYPAAIRRVILDEKASGTVMIYNAGISGLNKLLYSRKLMPSQ